MLPSGTSETGVAAGAVLNDTGDCDVNNAVHQGAKIGSYCCFEPDT